MLKALFLFLFSIGLGLWSVLAFGPSLTPLLVAAVFGCACAVFLLVRAARKKQPRWAVVDGSNVLYWRRDEPDLHSVRLVIEKLVAAGLDPVIWFDANVGYLVSGRYMNPYRLSQALRYPESRIYVAPKGTPADPLLIQAATDLNAHIVSNDRFRDWKEQFPQVDQAELFLRGEIVKGGVTLQ